MPAGQVFTNPGRALNAGQVCLLSTSRYTNAFNIIVWHHGEEWHHITYCYLMIQANVT